MGTETKKKKKFKLPHIFVLLTAIIVVCVSQPGFYQPENLTVR